MNFGPASCISVSHFNGSELTLKISSAADALSFLTKAPMMSISPGLPPFLPVIPSRVTMCRSSVVRTASAVSSKLMFWTGSGVRIMSPMTVPPEASAALMAFSRVLVSPPNFKGSTLTLNTFGVNVLWWYWSTLIMDLRATLPLRMISLKFFSMSLVGSAAIHAANALLESTASGNPGDESMDSRRTCWVSALFGRFKASMIDWNVMEARTSSSKLARLPLLGRISRSLRSSRGSAS